MQSGVHLMLRKLVSDMLLGSLHVFSQAHEPILHLLLDRLQNSTHVACNPVEQRCITTGLSVTEMDHKRRQLSDCSTAGGKSLA